MRKIDLKKLIKGQEIPRIQYRPIKILEDRVYFEKIIEGLDKYWTDGIHRYDIEEDKLTRVDEGIQTEYPSLFEMEVPSAYEDVIAMKDMQDIYYCMQAEAEGLSLVNFYRINIEDDTQQDILSYEYYNDEYEYEGMEVLTQDYFIFTLSPKFGDEKGPEHDKVYLVDVKEKAYYPVRDLPFRITGGKREVIGAENKFVFLEEIYLSEEEELEFLLSDELELIMKVPEDLDENFVYTNRLNLIPLENFIRLVKVGAYQYKYKELDFMGEEGLLRTIGETATKIYYKKAKHEHILRASKEFSDRIMIGKEEIFSIDKQTFQISKVMDMEGDSLLAFEGEEIYEVKETPEKIIVCRPDMKEMIAGRPDKIERYIYEKDYENKEFKEYFYDIFGHRYLAIGVISSKESTIKSHLKVVDLEGMEPDIQCIDLFIVEDTIFFG